MTSLLTQLTAAGEALYGSDWQRPIARGLEVDDRLVRRWVSGERPIPDWVPGKLRTLLRDKAAALRAVAKNL